MENQENLNKMLDNLINQNSDQAQVDFHEYLQTKMQDIIGNKDDQVETDNNEE